MAEEKESGKSVDEASEQEAFDGVMGGLMAAPEFGTRVGDSLPAPAEAPAEPAAEAAPEESEAGEPAAGAEGDEASGEESEESGEGSAFVPPSWAPRGYADWGNEDPGYWRERFAKEAESQVKFTGRIGQMGDQLRRLSERNAALERELRESREAAAASEPDLRELPGVKALRESDEVAGKALDEVISGLEGRLKARSAPEAAVPAAAVPAADPYLDGIRRDAYMKDLEDRLPGAGALASSKEFGEWIAARSGTAVGDLARSWDALDGVSVLHRYLLETGGSAPAAAAPAASPAPAAPAAKAGGRGSRGVRGESGRSASGASQDADRDIDRMSEEEAFAHVMRQPIPESPF